MSRSRFLMAILPLVCTAVAANDVPAVTGDEGAVLSPTDEYERAVNDAARHYVEAVRQARARYLDELDAAMREATREGDLDRALQLRSARQQQQRSVNVIPNPLASVSPEERLNTVCASIPRRQCR